VPLHRLYRLSDDNRIHDRVDLDAPNDEAAIEKAISFDHEAFIEI
jgi:hypothetical protein